LHFVDGEVWKKQGTASYEAGMPSGRTWYYMIIIISLD